MIRERTRAGPQEARARGTRFGRKPKLSLAQVTKPGKLIRSTSAGRLAAESPCAAGMAQRGTGLACNYKGSYSQERHHP
jgi:DNA invertase Pin-like site-specific DNA recombinase